MAQPTPEPSPPPLTGSPDDAAGTGSLLPDATPGPAAPPPEWPAIPGYDVLDRLAAGGMGVVYRVRHRQLGREVALKMVRGGPDSSPQELARFRAEAQAVAALDHQRVVRVYDFGEWRGQPYFTMELMSGGSLAAQLRGGPLAPKRAAWLVELLARAVQFVHDRQIVHRDLKPANVLMDEYGAPKIADFGLAKRLDCDRNITPSQAMLGTPSYMAPEQAQQGAKKVAPAADIYALGAILYECLTGQPPFQAATYWETLRRVVTEEPAPPRRWRPEVPADLEWVCLRCLAKEPGDRYASAAALADDLHRCVHSEPIDRHGEDVVAAHKRFARRVGYEVVNWLGLSRTDSVRVYVARESALDRRVLLKVDTSPPDGPARARFRREAALLARVSHPNVVHLYRFGEGGGLAYTVLEFVGGNLTQQFRGQAVDAPTAAAFVAALAGAVDELHRGGVVHGDLHPSNVLFTAARVPKLTGFGMAWALDRPPDPLTAAELPADDLTYAAPELLAGDWARAGPAADVYGLGGLLYRLLTGRRPFSYRPLPLQRERVLAGELRRPRQLVPEVPAELEEVCLHCLARRPEDRYANAAAVAADLRAYLPAAAGRAPAAEETSATESFR
jgi:serine/threonine protein kinase